MKRHWIFRGIGFFALMILGILALGYIITALWNNLIPELFGGPNITFGQALGLFILSRILFFSFRPWGWGGGYWRRHRGEYWRKRFDEKLNSMPPEERERFQQQYYDRCRHWNREPHQSANTASS